MENKETILMALQAIFKCENCGYCCKNENPIIICQQDIKKIAKYLDISYKKVRINYVRSEGGKLFIKSSKPCIFYDNDKKCTIYEARPLVCRAYPYLNMKTDFSIETVPAIGRCPGSIEASRHYMEFWNKIVDLAQRDQEVLNALNVLKDRYKGRKNEIIKNMQTKLKIKMGL